MDMAGCNGPLASCFYIVCWLVLACCQYDECPYFPSSRFGDQTDLNVGDFSFYIDQQDIPEVSTPQFYIIANGVIEFPFDSLTIIENPLLLRTLSENLPSNFSSIPVRLGVSDAAPSALYYAIATWPLDANIAPPGCPNRGVIQPGTNESVLIELPCHRAGSVSIQMCLTIGTEDFSSANGTYHTYTMYFPRICEAPVNSACSVDSNLNIADLCITPNQTRDIVLSGAGSWDLLLGILSTEGSFLRGYCLILSGVVVSLLQSDQLAVMYYIPDYFEDFVLYIGRPSNTPSPISFSIDLVVQNTTVLDQPVLTPSLGLSFEDRLDVNIHWPCKNPGFTRVLLSLYVSSVVDDIIYSNNYSEHYVYRNCTPDNFNSTVTVISLLGIEVGIPIVLLFILLVGVAVGVAIIMIYFTQRQKRKAYELEEQRQLQLLASSNAYMLQHFPDPLEFLTEYDIEYNYASIEVVSELGEGAFGRVFKARAPGIERDGVRPNEFVAVKTLKDDAESNLLDSFCSEVKISVMFEHPNVIRLLGVCTVTPQKCMIFEFMDAGSLNDLLRLSDPANPDNKTDLSSDKPSDSVLLTPDNFLSCSLQVAQGLVYLASLKFVHRDIATRNCLVDHNLIVKIADFGMSRDICGMDYYRIGSAKACLPVRWMPPEALLYGKFTVKSDVWSFGVLMWEIYTYAHQPHSGISNQEVIDRIKSGHVLECPDLCPASIYDIMKSCWTRLPAKRPKMSAVLNRIGHLYRSNSMNALDNYTLMAPAEGYMNLGYGVTAKEEELQEAQRVEAMLNKQENERNKELDEDQGGARP